MPPMYVDDLNLNKMLFPTDNEYNIPLIQKDQIDVEKIKKLIPFGINKARKGWCHFYLDDYRFVRVWNRPNKYLSMLNEFEGVLSPDFSLYSNYPKAIKIYNCYRSHWLAAYWQLHNIPVIPAVTWAEADSFEYCFDGYTKGSVVSVGTVGTAFNDKEGKAAFMLGYNEMLDRLKPSKIIAYGTKNEELGEDVIWFKSFAEERLRALR